MSAFEVDDVLDIARGTDGFRDGAGRAVKALGAGSTGAAFAAAGAVGCAGFAGAVCGVTSRDTGRGFGKGTAAAVQEISAKPLAPRNTAVKRAKRIGLADEGRNGITDSLCGESLTAFTLRCSALNMWTKHQMC
ncbi:MAG TPA: hypothetical protein VF467_00765 [Afipia sp.]